MPKFLVDESTGEKVARAICSEGFDTISVIEKMRGARDLEIIRKAIAEKRIIVTMTRILVNLFFVFDFCQQV